ncbi:MAG: cation:proton antiporter regulatory subunit, partial [Aquabacterium sp.]
PIRRVIRLVQDQRVARYGLLRGYFHGADDDSVDELELQRLQSITLEHDSVCVGQTLDASLDQRDVGVTVVSVRRAHGAVMSPAPSLRLEAGDTLVLSGRPQDLARAESLLLKG